MKNSLIFLIIIFCLLLFSCNNKLENPVSTYNQSTNPNLSYEFWSTFTVVQNNTNVSYILFDTIIYANWAYLTPYINFNTKKGDAKTTFQAYCSFKWNNCTSNYPWWNNFYIFDFSNNYIFYHTLAREPDVFSGFEEFTDYNLSLSPSTRYKWRIELESLNNEDNIEKISKSIYPVNK